MSDRPKAKQRKAPPGGRRPKKAAPAPRPRRWPQVLLVLAVGTLLLGIPGVGALWVWSRPVLPAPVADALPEYVGTPVPPERDAFPDYLAAGAALQLPPKEERAELWRKLAEARTLPPEGAALAAANGAALDAMRAAHRKPELQLMPPRHTTGTRLPTLAGVQDLARVGAADVRRRLAQGDHAGAFARATDVYTLGRRVRHGQSGSMIISLVGEVIDFRIHDALRADAVKVLAAPTPALEAFLKELNALDALERPVEEALRDERDAFARTARAEFPPKDQFEREAAEMKFTSAMVDTMKNGFDQQIALVRARDLLHANTTSLFDNPVKFFVCRLLHGDTMAALSVACDGEASYQGYTEKALIAEGRSDALRVWLALELHRRAAGKRPATIAALVPRWLPAVPLDPFAPGRPMAYRDGRLWSVALDRRDGGGKPELPFFSKDRVNGVRKVTKGDFVFLTAAGPR